MRSQIFLIIVFSLIALWPFFKTGYFESHDGEWMVIRFSAFHQTLVSGQIPVRFVDRLNNNYGYPVLNFLYPLPFYLAEIPKILGFGFVDSIKIVFVISTVASAVAMFWALSQVFYKWASFTGAILYIFAPYRFVDLYVRGSLGEIVAFVFLPLIFGAIFKIAKDQKIFLPVMAFLISFLILSHNVIAVIFLPFLLVVSLIIIKKEKWQIISSFVAGILIASFFWIPAVYDLKFVKLSEIKVSNVVDHLVGIRELTVPSWGYGPRPIGLESFSPQVGLIALAIVFSVLYLRFTKKTGEKLINFMLIIFTSSFFLMTKYSLSFWQYIPGIDIIQFPWRFLSLNIFIAAFLVAYVINHVKEQKLIAIIIVLAAIISTIVYTKPKTFVNRDDGFYSTNEDSTTVRDEYLPLWVKEKPKSRANQKIEIISGDAQITSSEIKQTNYKAAITAQNDSTIQINTIYFPGWQVKIDGRKTSIDYQNQNGLITFQLPQGVHEVIIKYNKTPVHLASEIISLVAIIVTGSYLYNLWRKQNS
ncbi:hypothetical protein A2W70_05405 [Candidatus Curtissbacteria bacterium RIFCSPLOWO2_02_41_11]|uniref:Membrane protein 6-pyruvoyl-tetrahydropterin synthase-related domain-containing protein n=2 Tax=Candidatus Curtissiibacteriota TaxID=1752717 RepID=A0A1F5HQ10_9BACT|nr:MAG: hypothetical protein UU56_C0009G0028 [Candidatus Curtissbacteria bacterium GW2011_GWA2_41_24]OGE06153.1 MAG: hypothetical protein A2W70_05405 [Candidatus Curtissbacteria bacterium RIFCSPLOWO2_02_41_11]